MCRRLLFLMVCLLGWAPAALAAEVCHQQKGRRADIKRCVSSVLPPRDAKNFEPAQLTGKGDGAWCEGASGTGVGETITLHQNPPQQVGVVFFVNGYADGPDSFLGYGRIKRARLETSGGVKRVIDLEDTPKEQMLTFRAHKPAWIKLTIVSVYPGKRHQDTCASMFYLGHEVSD